MLKANEIKKLIRSRSLDFVTNGRPGNYSDDLKSYNWKGHKIFYRAGTAEPGIIYEVLLRPRVILRPNKLFFKKKVTEYWLPKEVNPDVILDIGGNIGVTCIYFSYLFPNAKIHAFEPVKSNFELLKKNTSHLPNVTLHNIALGNEDKTADIFMCDDHNNTGGFSLYDRGVDKSEKEQVVVKQTANYLKEQGIDKVDLIKVDTEGAEYDILTSMDPALLEKTKWVTGELHGEKDFELLAYLSQWFDLDIKKSLRSRLFNFNARNKAYKQIIPWRY